MAHIHCDLCSESLDMMTAINVVLPENVKAHNAKVIYLLHGRADNCSRMVSFQQRGTICKTKKFSSGYPRGSTKLL